MKKLRCSVFMKLVGIIFIVVPLVVLIFGTIQTGGDLGLTGKETFVLVFLVLLVLGACSAFLVWLAQTKVGMFIFFPLWIVALIVLGVCDKREESDKKN